MSKGKNITLNQRGMIKIAKKLKLSRCAIQNAIQHINKFGMLENAPRAPRKRSTIERIDRIIRRLSEDNRQLTARDIYNEMKAYPECSLSVRSIRRRLVEAGLNGRVARKKPLISLKNRRARVAFAREHLTWSAVDWTKAVFSDESKFNRFGSDGKKYVRRRPGEEFMPKCTIPTIKHGGGSVMIWAVFNRNEPGPLHIVKGIMDSTSYRVTFYHMLVVKGWFESEYSTRIMIQNKQRYETLVPSEENHQNGVAVPEA
uniref:HTH_Tnp_Tc3_2 domain-containing protein n=1 Tax=Heterorhabditis bacteriophora TaxID=37862 RepID=A0A1I7XLR4_HETBA